MLLGEHHGDSIRPLVALRRIEEKMAQIHSEMLPRFARAQVLGRRTADPPPAGPAESAANRICSLERLPRARICVPICQGGKPCTDKDASRAFIHGSQRDCSERCRKAARKWWRCRKLRWSGSAAAPLGSLSPAKWHPFSPPPTRRPAHSLVSLIHARQQGDVLPSSPASTP
jgi:hypothetical protein